VKMFFSAVIYIFAAFGALIFLWELYVLMFLDGAALRGRTALLYRRADGEDIGLFLKKADILREKYAAEMDICLCGAFSAAEERAIRERGFYALGEEDGAGIFQDRGNGRLDNIQK